MIWTVRVKDRGRDLAWHRVEQAEEAEELRRVYESLGYASEKITIDQTAPEHLEAA